MLRFVVLILMLANGLYFAWTQNLLQAYGFAPTQQSEPQRLAEQIRPEAIRLLGAPELAQAEAASRVAAKPAVCLKAGLFDEAQSATLRRALETALPAGSWSLEASSLPGRWIVYLGKFSGTEARAKKRAELALMKFSFVPLDNPELEPGLSLGGFEARADADAELKTLTRRGLRTARVVQERAPVNGMLLRMPAVDEAMRAQLGDLKPTLVNKSLEPC